MPLIFSNYLNETLNWSDVEYTIGKKYLKWEELNIKFENIHLTWDEIFILLEIQKRRGGGGSGYPYRDDIERYERDNPWKKLRKDIGYENTEKVVKLYCNVMGIDYEMVKESKSDVKVTVNDFDRFLNESINIKVDLKNNI